LLYIASFLDRLDLMDVQEACWLIARTKVEQLNTRGPTLSNRPNTRRLAAAAEAASSSSTNKAVRN